MRPTKKSDLSEEKSEREDLKRVRIAGKFGISVLTLFIYSKLDEIMRSVSDCGPGALQRKKIHGPKFSEVENAWVIKMVPTATRGWVP